MAKIFFFLIIYLFTYLVNCVCLYPYFKKLQCIPPHPEVPGILCHKQSYQYELEEQSE